MNPRKHNLLSPQQALGNYLNEMLHRATVTVAPPPAVKPDGRDLPTETAASGSVAKPEPTAAVDTRSAADRAAATAQPEFEFPLQCLMFDVAGHRLSIPLIQLTSVVDWTDAITRLPESPPWMLGLIQHRGTSLRVVDSRQLLDIDAVADASPGHLLVLGDGSWAITCDQLQQVVNLAQDEVQWRQDSAQQLTLGTIRDSLATLLNPSGIAANLDARIEG